MPFCSFLQPSQGKHNRNGVEIYKCALQNLPCIKAAQFLNGTSEQKAKCDFQSRDGVASLMSERSNRRLLMERARLQRLKAKSRSPGHSAEGCCGCSIAGKGQKAGGGAVACLVTPVPEGRGDTTG